MIFSCKPATAGRLTTPWPPRASWRGLGLTLVLACMVAAALVALPAGAFAAESGACPNEALRSELGSSLLPECRAYEMVSPPYKDGQPLFMDQYSAGGEKAVLYSLGGIADIQGSGENAPQPDWSLGR